MNVSRPIKVSLIAAVARNGAIGAGNALLWRLPADLQHFKRTTLGHPIIMGRKTFDSIGKPLPGRRNIVVTRNARWQQADVEAVSSLQDALALLPPDSHAYVIGGGELYALALPLADELVLTEVDADFAGDTFFPKWERSAYKELERSSHTSEQGWAYHFVRYAKRS